MNKHHSIILRPDNLEINEEIKRALKNRKVRLTDLRKTLTLTVKEVERRTGLSSANATLLKSAVCQACLPHKPCTGLDLYKGSSPEYLKAWKLQTVCPIIDKFLKGGIHSGVLTEVSGESASGKTQLCLQLCISAQINKHKSGGAAYICTEDAFPIKRLHQLINFHSTTDVPRKKLGDGIFIEHVADFETLDLCVKRKLPILLNRGIIDIVIIDSVAALFRCHYNVTQTRERARHLLTFAASLQKLALQYNIPIICVNQVSASFKESSYGNNLIPSLGLTWSNQISCRIMLVRPQMLSSDMIEHQESREKQLTEPTYRKMSLIFSPTVAPAQMSIFIDNSGIHGIGVSRE